MSETKRALDDFGMPLRALAEMVKAVPDAVCRDLAADAQRGNPVTMGSSMLRPQAPEPVPVRGSGWSEPRPMGPQPGVALCDRMVDVQDAVERAELVARLGRLAKPEGA